MFHTILDCRLARDATQKKGKAFNRTVFLALVGMEWADDITVPPGFEHWPGCGAVAADELESSGSEDEDSVIKVGRYITSYFGP